MRTSALFETTEWHVGVKRVAAVDPGSSGLETVGGFQRPVDVSGEDCGGETIEGVVSLADNIFLVLKLD